MRGGKRGDVRTSEAVAHSFLKQVSNEILAATSTDLPMILCDQGMPERNSNPLFLKSI